MADVKWIKITTDMFDNRKIKHLRKLPEGNNIVLIWVMLLTMAGRCNSGGMIFLTENIPYTPKMLADELEFEESTVRLALEALEHFGMIVTNGDFFIISGWQEHQNIEGLDKIREQNRIRQKAWYDRQKGLPKPNVRPNINITQPNAIDIEEEREKEIDLDINNIGDSDESQPAKTAPKRKQFIPPTVEEVHEYCCERMNNVNAEAFVDFYESKGWMVGKNKMKDWKAAVRTWEKGRNNKPFTRKEEAIQNRVSVVDSW